MKDAIVLITSSIAAAKRYSAVLLDWLPLPKVEDEAQDARAAAGTPQTRHRSRETTNNVVRSPLLAFLSLLPQLEQNGLSGGFGAWQFAHVT